MNEIQHAKLVEGRICFVRTFDTPKLPTLTSSPIGLRRGGRSWQQYRRDFSLRTVLCQSCASRLCVLFSVFLPMDADCLRPL